MSAQIKSGPEVLETIRDYGWCAVLTPAGDENAPAGWRAGYAYSIGFGLTRGAPEAAIFGLGPSDARAALWRLWEKNLPPSALVDGAVVHGVLSDRPVILRRTSASRHEAYFAAAQETYAALAEFGRLNVAQIVYPDDAGRYPWDRWCDPDYRRAQPPLYASRVAS